MTITVLANTAAQWKSEGVNTVYIQLIVSPSADGWYMQRAVVDIVYCLIPLIDCDRHANLTPAWDTT